ncbi:MAG: non-ribosomal peptide synthetase [Chthoniobacterales bacterium]
MEAEKLSAARRALLQRYLGGGASPNETKSGTIPRRTEDGPAPLSYSQQQIWLHSQLAGDALIYNEPVTIHRHGELDLRALQRSFTAIVRRHQAWRTTFEWSGDRGVQIVQPAPEEITIPRVDLRASASPAAEALRLATADARRPFDLARGPLFRLLLASLGENEHRLFITLHHLIFDGVSLYRVFLPELLAGYASFAENITPTLPELPIQYPDYASWQRETFREIPGDQLAYWQRVCRDLPVLDLKADRPRPAVQNYGGAMELFEISARTGAALKSLGQDQNATPFMVMLAAFFALLRARSGQEDIVVGGISSGRQHTETMGLLGCFLNTLPIRCPVSPENSFLDLLARVRRETLGALSHDEVPFELLVQNFARTRDPSRAPLVQVLIVVEPPLDPLPAGWDFTHMDVDTGTAKFDLQLGLDERADGWSGRFIYNSELFARATMEDLRVRWLALLDRIAADPHQSISELTAAETATMPPAEWSGRRSDYPRDATIQELFEEQVRRDPSATALIFGETQLSYEALNLRANQLAHRLRELGVARDVPVGIRIERSPELIIALLAILKAGGAYLPLDPTYPAERLEFMIKDTGASVILTAARVAELTHDNRDNPEVEARATDLACLIYTSGSTGQPKGVAVPHRGVVRLVRGTNYANFSPNETFLQLAPISFDASTFEIWGALLNGGKLALIAEARPSLAEIGHAIRAHGVTTLWLTSALFNAMVDERLEDLRPLRQLLAGGDVLSPQHVHKALRELPGTRLINGYGPTESTTFACCYTIPRTAPPDRAIPIGQPIANTTAHILDAHLRPVAIGAVGELHLGGDGLARGYWQREELTAEKFIADPFSGERGARLYKTGDLARWRSDGEIEFLGRADDQIKLRGFRIEPGEIESALKQQTGVRDAAVILRENSPNEKSLVAYVVGEPGALGQARLLASLRAALPDYMIPSAIVSLPTMPRTANGKLDRNALPAPAAAGDFVQPHSPLEEKLAALVAKVLGLERVGADDNFFELGGHSLSGLRLVNQIREQLGLALPLAAIFEAPTISGLARLLATKTPGDAVSARTATLASVVPVNRESRRVRRA